jgi:hypothetical protein
VVHEGFHDVKIGKYKGAILKIDLSKAYIVLVIH